MNLLQIQPLELINNMGTSEILAQEERNREINKEIKEIVNLKPPTRSEFYNPEDKIEIPVEQDEDAGIKIIKYESLTDWKKLQEKNADCVGWISIPDEDPTKNIEYPLMQGANNDTYLYANPYKEYNSAGSIFVEQYNQPQHDNIRA